MKKFRCIVCGYIHEGEEAPENCPICNVPTERFVEWGIATTIHLSPSSVSEAAGELARQDGEQGTAAVG